MRNKLKRYTGAEVAQPKSIAEQLLAGTKLGNLLYGKQKTYKDGNNQERKDASFKESANGQMVQRMGETAKDAGELVATGLSFGNPLTAGTYMAPLIAGSQAYWITHGINDGAQRIENIGEGVKNFVEDPSWQNAGAIVNEVPMLVLDVAGALPVAKTVVETGKNAIPAAQQAAQRIVGSVDDVITTATKQAVESGVVGVNELPAQLAARAVSTPTITSPTLDRTVGIQNRVFTGDPVFPKDVWQIPAFNTNRAYRLTGQSQIDDMIQTGFVRPKAGKIKGGHTNEVHWSSGNDKFGYNIQPGQYILETPRSLVDGTSNAIGVNDLSHVWTTRNGQIVDIINELRPSKLTLAERMGIPKGDRGNLTVDQLEGLEDLMHYNTSGKYRWHLNYNDRTGFTRTTNANIPEGSIPGVKSLIDRGAIRRSEGAPIRLEIKNDNWTVWPSHTNSPATFSGGDFPVPEGMGWAPGDLSAGLYDASGKGIQVRMTSPRVDYITSLSDGSQSLIESLPNTIDKNIIRRFWQNNDQVILPGSYLSGDNGILPLGLNGISAIDQGKGMSGAISEILHPARFKPHGSGLSPDSMLSILKQGQRPRHAVRYGPGFTQLNNSAVYNKHIYDAWTKYKSGAMTANEFKTIFDDWFVPQGGRPLEIRTPNKFRWVRNNDGTKTLVQQDQTPYIVFPHPYVHYKKLGGKIETH